MSYAQANGSNMAGPSTSNSYQYPQQQQQPIFMTGLHPQQPQNGLAYVSPPQTPQTIPYSAVGSEDTAESQNGYYQSPAAAFHNEEILSHLYHTGFQMGSYSDVTLHIENRQYRLHSLILARSTTLAHLMSTSSHSHPQTIYIALAPEPLITEEGFSIALGYLYAAVSLQLVHPQNALSVLASACYLGGMDDLALHAYAVCKSSLSLDSLPGWLEFVEGVMGEMDSRERPAVTGDKDKDAGASRCGSILGVYADRLRDDILYYFIYLLPRELRAFEPQPQPPPPNTHTPAASPVQPSGHDIYLQLFTFLPFPLFKSSIESPMLPAPSDQIRYNFAKACVAARRPGRGREGEETVVLQFGSGESGSAVCVTNKNRKRALWKVTK